MKFSVLDQSPMRSGGTAADALRETIELAQITERLGYHRYWVAEHHGSASFAGSSPEVLISAIAAHTSRIRVGSGGVMLMHYSPLKVAENFRLLETLYPGRIDLGVGRAPGSDGITALALAYGSKIGIEYFPAKLADLKAFISGAPPYTEALERVRVTPEPATMPEIWMLASSEDGARLAAHFGLPMSFAHFIAPQSAESSCQIYRDNFRPTATCAAPRVSLGVFVLCADSDEEAQLLARCRDLWRARVERGEFGPFPSPAEALAHHMTPHEREKIASRREHQILGTKEPVRAQLAALAASCGAEELVVVSITHEFQQRVRCYELLMEAN
ncbi:MAG: LLM class flavin-dependent oxidoreductase [Proteobacteria bacterium]|jgi:luciferase family oxidoreductase group 1|nr:LLM class flavin-dependent oxidoreductase [Pseudomonadota bacterium]